MKRNTLHFNARVGLQKYLGLEAGQQFLKAAIESRNQYKDTGLHVTHEEFSLWVDQLQTNPHAARPASHT
jgi:predicted transcriptional regulator